MKKLLSCLLLAALVTFPTLARADRSVDELGKCLVSHLDAKERKNLAKWIYFVMSAHPELKKYSAATPKDVQVSQEYMGKLLTRMITEDCPAQYKRAFARNPNAAEKAFELVGQVAMEELMSNPEVTKSVANYVQYVDLVKVGQLLLSK